MLVFENMEFFRNCLIRVPAASDAIEHETLLIVSKNLKVKPRIFCSCSRGKSPRCNHVNELTNSYEEYLNANQNNLPHEQFHAHPFHTLLAPLSCANPLAVEQCVADITPTDGAITCTISFLKDQTPLITYTSSQSDVKRFMSRFSFSSQQGKKFTRHVLIKQSHRFVLTEAELKLAEFGSKTKGLVEQESIWYRLAYHCFREFVFAETLIQPAIDTKTGECSLVFTDANQLRKISILVEKRAVIPLLLIFRKLSRSTYPFIHDPHEKELLFSLKMHHVDAAVEIIPQVKINGTNSTVQYFEVQENFFYGSHLFVPEIQTFVFFSMQSIQRISKQWHQKQQIPLAEISSYIETNAWVFSFESQSQSQSQSEEQMDLFGRSAGSDDLARFVNCEIIKNFDTIEILPYSIEKKICKASIHYRKKDISVPLTDIVGTRARKERFVIKDSYIVDCNSDEIKPIGTGIGTFDKETMVGIHTASLLRLNHSRSCKVRIRGKNRLSYKLKLMLQEESEQKEFECTDLSVVLRNYQKNGISWLLFLYEYQLGGMLCDEMGLGKTVQILGFLNALKEQRECTLPFLVVCPTTVMGHWQHLCQQFFPKLSLYLFHGEQRVLSNTADILLTSYGILRNETETLSTKHFAVAVFDEAHYLKNQQTATTRAAGAIHADLKICMTGTPIENSLTDLKTLFDLILPGYLGDDETFRQTFIDTLESNAVIRQKSLLQQLHSITKPFILRRLKSSVLTELPPKIEDEFTCEMSCEQERLYAEATRSNGIRFLEMLRSKDQEIPYLHIFALFNLYRKICNHPVLVSDTLQLYHTMSSGKWDLFVELLEQGINSGQKVVVFCNYLNMLKIMQMHAESRSIGFVTLTGATTKRTEIIKKFNTDPQCRLFLGSLKAGGIGVDLTAASMVIHYDRWWNASREDQATDRVHRIGQVRGVQVIKLITRNSIEEGIARIIAKKKQLSTDALVEDVADSVKVFTRDDLIELLETASQYYL